MNVIGEKKEKVEMGKGRDFSFHFFSLVIQQRWCMDISKFFSFFSNTFIGSNNCCLSSNVEFHLSWITKGGITSNSPCENVLSVFISYHIAADLQELF